MVFREVYVRKVIQPLRIHAAVLLDMIDQIYHYSLYLANVPMYMYAPLDLLTNQRYTSLPENIVQFQRPR